MNKLLATLVLLTAPLAHGFDYFDAMYNPASMDYIVYHSLLTDDSSSTNCDCRRDPPELSEAAKKRIEARIKQTEKTVQEFRESPLGKKILMPTMSYQMSK